jgi:hypothetical protein
MYIYIHINQTNLICTYNIENIETLYLLLVILFSCFCTDKLVSQ